MARLGSQGPRLHPVRCGRSRQARFHDFDRQVNSLTMLHRGRGWITIRDNLANSRVHARRSPRAHSLVFATRVPNGAKTITLGWLWTGQRPTGQTARIGNLSLRGTNDRDRTAPDERMTSVPSSHPALPMITPSASGLVKRLSQGDSHSLRLREFATDGRATIRPEEDWPLRRIRTEGVEDSRNRT